MIHDVACMAPTLVLAIEIEMFLLKRRWNQRGGDIAVAFVGAFLRSARPKLPGGNPDRYTGIAVSTVRAVDRITTASKSGLDQNTEQRIINVVIWIQQHRRSGLRFDVGAGMGC